MAGTEQIEKISDDGKLAVLCVRVGLAFNRERDDARLTEQKLVASHMRVTFTVPEHRNYIYSGYPSEPILAEAAAQLMYLNSMHNGIPDVLLNWCKNDLIPKGERGELVARLLLTKAHDHAVARLFPKDTPTYTTPILLVDFLIALVGESHAEKLFNMVPDNVLDLTTLKESRLGSSKLNFTHWVKAGDSCAVTDEAGVAGLGRSMAWQCYDQQEAVDLVIPLLLEDEDEDTKLGRDNVSAIFLQIKNRNRPQKVDVDAENLGFFTRHLDKEEKPRPYLTIVLNLGVHEQNTSSPVQIPTPVMRKSPRTARSQRPRYSFKVFGCSHDAFPDIISKHEESKYDVILASGTLLDEHTRQGDIFLKALIDLKPFWIKNQDGHGSFIWYDFGNGSPLDVRTDPTSKRHLTKVMDPGAGDESNELNNDTGNGQDGDGGVSTTKAPVRSTRQKTNKRTGSDNGNSGASTSKRPVGLSKRQKTRSNDKPGDSGDGSGGASFDGRRRSGRLRGSTLARH